MMGRHSTSALLPANRNSTMILIGMDTHSKDLIGASSNCSIGFPNSQFGCLLIATREVPWVAESLKEIL
jgi:hypothetical protein